MHRNHPLWVQKQLWEHLPVGKSEWIFTFPLSQAICSSFKDLPLRCPFNGLSLISIFLASRGCGTAICHYKKVKARTVSAMLGDIKLLKKLYIIKKFSNIHKWRVQDNESPGTHHTASIFINILPILLHISSLPHFLTPPLPLF